jgi:transcription antitermination protein NusB
MPASLQKNREILFYLLYSADFGGDEEATALIMQQLTVTRSEVRHAHEQMRAVREKQSQIDQLIKERSKEYDFERIGRVERTLLRLCSFELLFSTVPPKVAIAEAIRLARKFAAPESAAFVNAVLDTIYAHSRV